MTQVNLLPWREEARRIKKLRFLITFALFISFSIVIEIIVHIFFSGLIHSQEDTNNYFQSQLTKEQAVVANLNKKKKNDSTIVTELQEAYNLQNQSFKAVSLMNLFANIMPEGATLTKFTREGDNITLMGKAQSSLEVTALMENIVKTNKFNQPVLTEISGQENDKDKPKTANAGEEKLFQIKVVQK